MLVCLDQRNGAGCGATNSDTAKHCSKCGMSLRYALAIHNPGAVIASYQIANIIGYGGFGAVYHAKDTRNGQDVALKETFDPASIRAFQGEFAVLHHLDHDHLPNYYAMFEAEGNGYLVMELVPGQSLLEVLQRRQGQPLAEGQVLGYAHQICDALIYLHHQTPPLIHRDIKPANIRLTPDGLIKLVDFGLLKQGTDKTGSSRMGLTPAYAPLEQWGGTGMHTSPQSDLYSLGATLYHLLTGHAPPTVTDRIAATNDPLPPPTDYNPRLSPHVANALVKVLAVRPPDRFEDAWSFKQALMGATTTPATHTTITPPQPTPTPLPQQITPVPDYLSTEPTQVAPTQVAPISTPTQVAPTSMSTPTKQWWSWKWWGMWIIATALSWAIGWSLANFVLGMLYEIVGVFFYSILYGITGIFVGFAQWLMLRHRLSPFAVFWWVVASAIGWSLGALTADLILFQWLGIFGSVSHGVSIGFAQWLVLRKRVQQAGWWILATTVGWTIAWMVVRVLYLGLVDTLIGGAIAGAVTGAAMLWLLRGSKNRR